MTQDKTSKLFLVHSVLLLSLFLFVPGTLVASVPQPIGNYFSGELKNGINARKLFLKSNELIESMSPSGFQYSSQEMVDTLFGIAKWVKKNTSFHLQVGDIAKPGGGKLGGHISHQIGLGADVAYLPKKLKKEGHRWKKYQNKFTQKYEGKKGVFSSFDLDLNLKLLHYIAETYPVKKIYVGCWMYKDMKAKLDPNSALKEVLRPDLYHEDHFHLRLKCPPGAKDCTEKRPSRKKAKKKKRTKKKLWGCDRFYSKSKV